MNDWDTIIAVTRAEDYNAAQVTAAVRRQFELLSLHKMLEQRRLEKGGKLRVLLKPNLLMKRRPEEATTTHPTVVSGVIQCLRECGVSDIVVADSPGGPYTRAYLAPIYDASGMRAVADASEGAARLNLDCGSFERRNETGKASKTFTLIDPVREADFIINLPKLKTHGMMTLSGGVKNLFGCIPGLMKPELHWRFPDNSLFAEMLVDLSETVAPDLTICDGIIAMEGDGPSGGTPKPVGALFGALSPWNLDVALCNVISLEVDKVPTVQESIRRGLAVSSVEQLQLLGDPIPRAGEFKLPKSKSVDFTKRLPGPLQPLADRLLRDRPAIQRKKCIGCGKCAESCPAKTIRIAERKAYIDYTNCIRCYCCHEMCPVRAIDIKRLKLFNL